MHLVGGLVGTLLLGFFVTTSVNESGPNGLFYGGGLEQLDKQATGAFAVLIYSFVIALVLGFLLKVTIGLRVDKDAEVTGIDEAEHAESAYDSVGQAGRVASTHTGVAGTTKKLEETSS